MNNASSSTNSRVAHIIVAGVAYLVWYKLLRKRISYKKIQLRFPDNKDLRREIGYSVISICIFTLVPITILQTSLVTYTQYYKDIHEQSMLYFSLAFPLIFSYSRHLLLLDS